MRIVEALQTDGRTAYAELARTVSVPPALSPNASDGWRKPA